MYIHIYKDYMYISPVTDTSAWIPKTTSLKIERGEKTPSAPQHSILRTLRLMPCDSWGWGEQRWNRGSKQSMENDKHRSHLRPNVSQDQSCPVHIFVTFFF